MKKGFTLIELLAVIVILSIISIITVPILLDVIEEANKGAAKASMLEYIEAIENKIMLSDLQYEDKEDYTYDEIEIDIKGKEPTSGIYTLKNKRVISGTFCINGYEIIYYENKVEVKEKCTGEDIKLPGGIKLSENSGHYEYPNSNSFMVLENISGGILSCTTSDEEVATCEINDMTVTVIPGTKKGIADITIKSEGNSKYKAAQAVYVVINNKELLSVTATGYDKPYDGEEHGITVTSSGATIKYGTSEGIYTLDESPKYTDVGTYIVYYQVTKEGYETIEGSRTVVITQLMASNISYGEITVQNAIDDLYNKLK